MISSVVFVDVVVPGGDDQLVGWCCHDWPGGDDGPNLPCLVGRDLSSHKHFYRLAKVMHWQ